MKHLFILLISLLFAGSLSAQGPQMRFPDIHGDMIVFVHAEDIWSVSAKGGIASRLTFHEGAEVQPKFSPDGSLIAFTGNYDGNADVYVMNPYGGEINRVTFHPGYDEVVGWHPTKNKIIFRARRGFFPQYNRLYMISPDGSGFEEVVLYQASQGSFSPDGNMIAFNKGSRENRTWKRYKGGTAQEIYVYDLEKMEERNLSNFEGTDRIPMWIGNKIYFTSDRNNTLNVYSIDPATGESEQLTYHEYYDARRPGNDDSQIIYELGGKLNVLDIKTKRTREVNIEIKAELPEVRPYFKNVKDYITHAALSPKGERALITARGEVFSVPSENGSILNLTNSSGARDKDAVWSPDGKWIAWFSDMDGEYELYVSAPEADAKPKKLTNIATGYRHTLRWSPDSKMLAYTDNTLSLFLIDIATKKITKVDKAEYENIDVSIDVKPIYDFQWSPTSKYIAYSKMDADKVYKVYIYDLAAKKVHCISGIFNDFHPVFSTDGQYLFFVSNRRFNPTFCDFEWQLVYKKTSGIYYVSLQEDAPSLLPYLVDEVNGESKKAEGATEKTIDWEGINSRIEALPLGRSNYRYLQANEKGLFYLDKDEGDFNRFEYRVPRSLDLHFYDFKKQKSHKVISGIGDYSLSADGNKVIYTQGSKVGILDASAKDSKGNPLNLADLTMYLEPKAEWKQIFNEAWRMERDFYYEPGMHGLDWDAMKEKYEPLIEYSSCRQDVQYIIGELIGELNTSHTYVYGGDRKRRADNVSVGLLGADYMISKKHNLYQFATILDVSDWSRGIYPPLAKPGLDIKQGNYLLEVNGKKVTADKNIYSYFQNLANKEITIKVNDKPEMEGAREYVVKTVSNEYRLRYQYWAEHNRRTVEEASDGKIGYIHMPDTYLGSATEFPKYYYGQTTKEGIILDGRFNGGGLDPVIFLNRLMKEPHSYWTRRYSHDQTSPQFSVTAHMVCLTNREAGSGGDELPDEFQQFNMGPVIGTRTWGGLVGVSMFIPLIDGGGLTAPDYRIYNEEGNWIVENEGVTPDIILELDTKQMLKGYDAQLMKAVEVLKEKIKAEPHSWPKHQEFPKQELD